MLKPLRHPTVFVLLTAFLAGWTFAVSRFIVESSTIGWSRDSIHAPIYELLTDQYQYSFSMYRSLNGITRQDTDIYAYELDGRFVFDRLPADSPTPSRSGTAPVALIAAWSEQGDAWGLTLPALEEHAHRYSVNWIAGEARPDDNETVTDAARAAGFIPPVSALRVNWPFAMHDAALAFALLVWLYALFSVFTWKLWRSLTPSQRRRRRHACPDCGYDRSAAPTKPCPECGLTSL